MLLEIAADLKTSVDSFRLEKAAAKDRSAYRTRANQLAAPAGKVAALATMTHELAANGIEVTYQNETVAALGRMAKERLIRFKEDPASLLTPDPNYLNQFLPGVTKVAQVWEGLLLSAWQQRVTTATLQLPQEVLAVLEVVPDYAAAVRDLRTEQGTIRQLGQSLPGQGLVAGALATLARSAKAIDQTWQQISGSDIPDYAFKFIRNAGGAGVPLSEISEELLEWLRARNLTSSFLIRPRST